MNSIEVKGVETVVKAIHSLSKIGVTYKSLMISKLEKIAAPTLAAAKTMAPVSKKEHTIRKKRIQPGNLQKSIGFITGKNENPTVYVGPRVKEGHQGWYGAMVETGHNIYNNKKRKYKGKLSNKSVLSRITKKRGGNVAGKVEGKFYMQKAYQATGGMVTKSAETEFANYIQSEINKQFL